MRESNVEGFMRIWLSLGMVALSTPVGAAMPPAEQNALVKRYCAVCHTDAARNGGLSLEHYDAAKRDPTLAAMMLTKLNNGAMGAAGDGVPDKAAQQAWLESTTEQATGATEWFVNRDGDSVSASMVREAPPRKPGSTDAPLYRVRVSCEVSTGAGQMELTWAPQPQTDHTMTASVDQNAPVEYTIEGRESMGNGTKARTGRASVFLSGGSGPKLGLANQSLTIRELFPGETIEFPFSKLDLKTRAELRKCF